MRRQRPVGLFLNGSLKQSGVTFYLRNGEAIIRSAYSHQPKRRTRAQFIARQQLSHSCRLWSMYRFYAKVLFTPSPTAYARFRSLMRRTPVVFLPCNGDLDGATLLLPHMPASDGVLPVVEQHLGEVDGTAALLTSLKPTDIQRGDKLYLYIFHQFIENRRPIVRVNAKREKIEDFQLVDGRMALVSDDFADTMTGWALVHQRGKKCSSLEVFSRCTY